MGRDSRDIIRDLQAPKDRAVDLSSGRLARETVRGMAGYIALVHKDKGTSYGVSFPDVPGCISAGNTFEEALANAAEALAGHLALMREDGEAIPPPRSRADILKDEAWSAEVEGASIRAVSPAGRAARRTSVNAALMRVAVNRGAQVMAKSTRNTGKNWTPAEVKQVRQLAKENTPTRVIGIKLGRSEGAIRSKATAEGISLKPTNQSPYSRKK